MFINTNKPTCKKCKGYALRFILKPVRKWRQYLNLLKMFIKTAKMYIKGLVFNTGVSNAYLW